MGIKTTICSLFAGLFAFTLHAAESKLSIDRDVATGKIIVSWTGRGILEEASSVNGTYRPVPKKGGGSYVVIDATKSHGVFHLKRTATANDGPVYSMNIVGYVNKQLPPGLTLLANPLYQPTNSIAVWWPTAPDGAQIFKYTAGNGYEVATFDGVTGIWSNPNMEIPLGTGFYFRNPTTSTIMQTWVGEVVQGVVVNPLPAGYSTKGSMIPQEGSINSLHNIPGQAGDELRLYVNDLQGGGHELISTFDGTANAWVPDLQLGVGDGFWIHKQNAQDWVRVFYAY